MNYNWCPKCNFPIYSPYHLQQHNLLYHTTTNKESFRNGKNFSCSKCKTLFFIERYKDEHEKSCQKEDIEQIIEEFNCIECDQNFINADMLKHHSKIHTKKPSFKCSYCHIAFDTKQSITQHERIHDRKQYDLSKFICGYCNQEFNQENDLYEHEGIHINQLRSIGIYISRK